MKPADHYQALFADAQRAGVHHLPHGDPEPLFAGAEAAGCLVQRVDLAGARDKDEMLTAIGKSLGFPEWFGHNWDALADCLGDLSWLQADGYLILHEHGDGFRASHGEDFATALQIFEAAAEAWRQARIPFWVLVGNHAEGIAHLPGIE